MIPTKNNVDTIGQCLSSLMPYYEQRYVSEIIIVDAHSKDGTLETVKDFPVKLLFDEGINNPYFAREIGWRNAKGELILFMDSDTYLGEGFFPRVFELFKDEKVGIVGCWAKAVVTNKLTEIIGEWWEYHGEKLKCIQGSHSLIERLYRNVVWHGSRSVDVTGPCFMVRKKCLEVTNGFKPFLKPDRRLSADHLLSQTIVEAGWKSAWWVDAPLYRYPSKSTRHLIERYHRWGKGDAFMQSEGQKFFSTKKFLLSHLGAPLVSLLLTIRFRSFLHIPFFTIANYAWLMGYLQTCWSTYQEQRAKTNMTYFRNIHDVSDFSIISSAYVMRYSMEILSSTDPV